MDERKPQRAIEALRQFLETPLDRLLGGSSGADPAAQALSLFREMAARVPAYGRFLAEQGIDPASIREPDDFARLPLTDKANYLLRHPLADLCRDGRLESCDMMAVSSGSTGKPTFWPRFVSDELGTAARFEQAFHDSFAADRRRTLAVVCFALGTWVGGLFTTACCRHLAAKGYPIMVVAPGNNKTEIWRVVRELAPQFEQTVLLGYPPFLKDVIDGGIAEGIDWRPFGVKLVMAGEVFSEEWRDLVGERAGIAEPAFGSVALYGTADAGVLGNETPLSITIRRHLGQDPEAARALFGESRLPTLVQYDPRARYFETRDGTLLFSGSNGVPLLRYHIADKGGIVPYDAMLRFLAERGFDPVAALARERGTATPPGRGLRSLPFVYVFGRSNFTVSYFGANIYPENVTVGLEQPPIAGWVTGKFVLQAVEGLDQAPHLAIAVELAPGIAAEDAKRDAIAQSILAQLLRLNSEFQAYTPPEYRLPRVTLKPTGDPDWFPVGVKHRYTRK
ncbi:phenylacetate--CoA ligase [Hypericibacter adhaerens]|uniref:Phenylacetate--CoA ligase n=2 Tax=Hypericibacter adhaerens TaxID=2602016 RepID=A0A5J6MS78_9PROT|nr:phenylacetate--CoA ligase [Hypericibacter adhaerens]